MERELKATTWTIAVYLVSGLVWLCSGILNLFEDSTLCKIVALVLWALNAVTMAVVLLKKREHYDEMANAHFMTATSYGFATLLFAMLLFSLGLDMFHLGGTAFHLEYETVAPFLLGIGMITVGLTFARLERKGD